MTKTQFEKKFNELLRNANKEAKKKSIQLFKSGAINTSKYEDDFMLPRIIFSAVADHIKYQFSSLSGEAKREIVNLKYF